MESGTNQSISIMCRYLIKSIDLCKLLLEVSYLNAGCIFFVEGGDGASHPVLQPVSQLPPHLLQLVLLPLSHTLLHDGLEVVVKEVLKERKMCARILYF